MMKNSVTSTDPDVSSGYNTQPGPCQATERPVNDDVKTLHHKYLTMDDMQVPSGSWKDHHTKNNRYYNKILIFGFISLVGSIIVVSIM